ncbi:hypothetical protein MRB53_031118 [Persea americana]|uniref:Uncharacterized protein n=1 Tax=Persea americana TaxID=3435 RepID=A0ACC2KNN2_PERAE|nr:hypothetical protein MRB53_031118 [Persea americana]
MASSGGSRFSNSVSAQDKGSRNKRKFGTEDEGKVPQQMDHPNFEFGKSYNSPSIKQQSVCTSRGFNYNKLETFTANLNSLGSGGTCNPEYGDYGDYGNYGDYGDYGHYRDESEADEIQDTDWSDTTQSQLEELSLTNLDMIFKNAIQKIVSYGYSEEVVRKATSRLGVCYGCKDTISNIVDNTLAFLKNNGPEVVSSGDFHFFEDLKQLERYMLAEMVCVLREVKPFFSAGDAMWCLLMCDMNVSHACAMDVGPSYRFCGHENTGSSSVSTASQLKSEGKSSITPSTPELDIPKPSKPNHLTVQRKERSSSSTDAVEEPFTVSGKCVSTISHSSVFQSSAPEEKSNGSRKGRTNRREPALRQSPAHMEKMYRACGSKGSLRSGKLNTLSNFLSNMNYKSAPDSTTSYSKNASLKTSKAVGADSSETEGSTNLSSKAGPTSRSSAHPVPSDNASGLPLASTRLSLSFDPFPSESNDTSKHECNVDSTSCGYCEISPDKVLDHWILKGKDELLLKLIRVRELQIQMQEWTEWGQQKVMQAAHTLNKDKAELKTLRQEKEEVAHLQKEKQTLEDNTMKKLAEMENALCKAGGQVERANAALQRLEVENYALRQEMENAKLQAEKSALSFQEASQKEKNTLKEFQSWERQKIIFQEELVNERVKLSQLQQLVEQAKEFQDPLEARWRREEKVQEEVLTQAISIRKEREQIMEALAKSNEDLIKEETNMQRNGADIQRLEKEIASLRLKNNSSKVAALHMGTDITYASRLAYVKNIPALKEANLNCSHEMITYACHLKDVKSIPASKDTNPSCIPEMINYASCLMDLKSIPALKETNPYCTPEMITYASCLTDDKSFPAFKETNSNYIPEMIDFQDSGIGDVQRERECVMCLTDEMSVVFLPCAHQVVCLKCNELHEKQGMKDCPSCRTPIQRRICVRLAEY